jgi:hypothetical protein
MPKSAANANQPGRRHEDAAGGCRERVDGGDPEGAPGPYEILAQSIEVGKAPKAGGKVLGAVPAGVEGVGETIALARWA